MSFRKTAKMLQLLAVTWFGKSAKTFLPTIVLVQEWCRDTAATSYIVQEKCKDVAAGS